MTENLQFQDLFRALKFAPELSERVMTTYVRLWQLETWLRHMVYVEFRAKYGDNWHTRLHSKNSEYAMSNDKVLKHMPSPEETDISFASFGTLRKAIAEEWSLFEAYLPPKNIWEARLDEVEQIRHRVAHFRRGHRDDLQRVTQLLRDIDDGMWSFCISLSHVSRYSSFSNDTRDPVTYEYGYLNSYAAPPEIGYKDPHKFGYLKRTLELSFEVHRRLWVEEHVGPAVAGIAGFIYDIDFHVFDSNRKIDYQEFLTRTRHIHSHIVYFRLHEMSDIVRVSIPAVLGKDQIISLIDAVLDAVANSLRTVHHRDTLPTIGPESDLWYQQEANKIQHIADNWPEYVLGPNHPLAFLDVDMKFSIFGV